MYHVLQAWQLMRPGDSLITRELWSAQRLIVDDEISIFCIVYWKPFDEQGTIQLAFEERLIDGSPDDDSATWARMGSFPLELLAVTVQ